MAALALALTGAGEASAETLYAAPGASQTAEECTAAAPCTLFTARQLAEAGDTLALAPGRYDGEGNLIFDVPVTLEGVRGNRPVLDVATLQLPAGSALRDVTVRGSADRVLVVRGTAERVEVTNSGGGPGNDLRDPRHAGQQRLLHDRRGDRGRRRRHAAARHRAQRRRRAARRRGATTAVNSILAGATDVAGAASRSITRTPATATRSSRSSPPASCCRRRARRRSTPAPPRCAGELDLSGGPRAAGAAARPGCARVPAGGARRSPPARPSRRATARP